MQDRAESYERLAFLGDSVLSLSVSTHIFPRYPEFGAGRLTKLRAQAVSREACAEVGRRLGVVERLQEAAPDGTPTCWWGPTASSPLCARRSSALPI